MRVPCTTPAPPLGHGLAVLAVASRGHPRARMRASDAYADRAGPARSRGSRLLSFPAQGPSCLPETVRTPGCPAPWRTSAHLGSSWDTPVHPLQGTLGRSFPLSAPVSSCDQLCIKWALVQRCQQDEGVGDASMRVRVQLLWEPRFLEVIRMLSPEETYTGCTRGPQSRSGAHRYSEHGQRQGEGWKSCWLTTRVLAGTPPIL